MSRKPASPPESGEPGAASRYAEITLQQLRVLWAVAHAESGVKAAKLLNLSQPTISQHLGKLEALVGVRLFDRTTGRMVPTTQGAALVQHASRVLQVMQGLEDSLAASTRPVIRIAGIGSIVRLLLPDALRAVQAEFPDIVFDIHEGSPSEVGDLLNARRVTVGLVATAAGPARPGHAVQLPIARDPYVLVAPQSLDLDGIVSPAELSPAQRETLSRSIRFVYGSERDASVDAWYADHLPQSRTLVECRSFEAAVAFARAGLGVCLAPALSCGGEASGLSGVRLYATELAADRELVGMVLPEHRDEPAIACLVAAIQEAGRQFRQSSVRPIPPLLRSKAD